jgi:hypothetical protein
MWVSTHFGSTCQQLLRLAAAARTAGGHNSTLPRDVNTTLSESGQCTPAAPAAPLPPLPPAAAAAADDAAELPPLPSEDDPAVAPIDPLLPAKPGVTHYYGQGMKQATVIDLLHIWRPT